MTIPYLPGWFDQNKEAIQNIISAGVRAFNPQLENRMMLQQLMQNPETVQRLVDIASTNPEMIQNLYGAQSLGMIQGMGAPSSAAQIEQAGREILRTGQVPETPVGEAAAAQLRFRTPAQKKAEEAALRAQQQQTDYYTFKLNREQLQAALEDPQIQARMKGINDALVQNPDAAALDPVGLAQQYRSGTGDRTALMSQITAMAAANPVAAELFSESLRTLNSEALQSAVDRRAFERENAVAQRQEASLDRTLRLQAIDLAKSYGVNLEDALKFVRGEAGGEVVQAAIGADIATKQRATRLQALTRLSTQMKDFAKADRGAKADLQTILNTSLQEIVGMPIRVESTDGNWFSNKTKYKIGNQEITGQQFEQIIANPEEAMSQMSRMNQVESMTLEQVDQSLRDLEAARNQLAPAIYEREKALLTRKRQTLSRTRR